MPVNPVTYAEVTLGVHTCHDSALEARKLLEASLDELNAARAAKREAEFDLASHEVELRGEESGKHPEMSATAMNAHLKDVFWSDAPWLEVKQLIDRRAEQIDQAEADVRLAEMDARTAQSRMTELAGYLTFLGAAKDAETRTREAQLAEASKT